MEKEKKTEANALTPIPASERRSWLSMMFVQAGICVCVPAFLLGALLGEAMPLWPAIISGSLGYLLVVLGMIVIGIIGTDIGIASCTVAESTFGKTGARFLVSILFAINAIGWFGIQNEVCGEAVSNYLNMQFGLQASVSACSIVCGIIMLLTAVFGLRALEKLNYVSIPFLIIAMILGTYLAISKYGLHALDQEVPQTMSFLAGVSLSFNFTAMGTITAADYTRFQKSRKDTVLSVGLGVFPMGVVTLLLGILLTKIAGNYDISMVLIDVGIPLFGIGALILSTWTTNSTNAYSGGLNVAMLLHVPDNRRREVTLAVGLVGTFLGVFGILDFIEGFLSLLSFIVCPVGGIMIADYWIIGKGKPENWHSCEGVKMLAVITWLISAVAAYLINIEYSGILIAIVIYIILERFIPSNAREHKIS